MSDILHRVGIGAKADQVFKALTTIEGQRGRRFSTATGPDRVFCIFSSSATTRTLLRNSAPPGVRCRGMCSGSSKST